MMPHSRSAIVFAIAAAALLPAGTAQAQWYSSAAPQPAPLYPYAVDTTQPYAVEVAPNTYVIKRPGEPRQPSHSRRAATESGARVIQMPDRNPVPRSKADPALIEELRNGGKAKQTVVNTTRIVRDKPVVIEHKRYVDDPPRVVERYTVVDDDKQAHKPASKGDDKRVIQADAEITILGPDRMSIRLFRKGDARKAHAEAGVD